MKNLNKNSGKKGFGLVAAVAIMFLAAVLSLSLASFLGATSRGSLDYVRSSQAWAITQGGLNWYMMKLAGVSDWSTEANQTGITLGEGTFDITINSRTSGTINFTVTGKIAGTDGVTVQRTMTQSARMAPVGSKFALYWGNDDGNINFNNVDISGDYWSRGTTAFQSSSSIVNGIAYRPDTEDITGGGTYTEEAVASPYPSMIVLDLSYYTNLCSTYDAMITGSGDIDQNTDITLTGNTITCRDFSTNTSAGTNITISGYGYIVASRDINLNADGGNGRTLTVSPSGGNIVFISARNMTINSGGGSNTVTINSSARFYSRNNGNSRLITINNNNTNIDGALILANRRVVVHNSANLVDSTLFVNYPGSANNNQIDVTNSGTIVGTAAAPCMLISIGRHSPSLTIDNNADVAGFLYQYDSANDGSLRLNNCAVTGSVVTNQLGGGTMTNVSITYDESAIPSVEGGSYCASKNANSWTGN